MKNIFIALVLLISSISFQDLLAVPAVPWAVEKVQPDGSVIEVYIKGDEKVNWMESLDGYSLLYNEDQFVVYAQLNEDGDMVPSSLVYRMEDAESTEVKRTLSSIPKGLYYSKSQVDILLQLWNIEEDMAMRNQRGEVKGDKKALCILAGFSDKTFTKTQQQFDNLINQVGYNEGSAVGSVKDFYRENSYGQMDLTTTVVGPVSLSNTASYYAASNSRYQLFAEEVMQLADKFVDFSEFANENGVVETIHIIFAGYGDEAIKNKQQIWSHKSSLRFPLTIDGVKCQVYSCSPELRGYNGTEITSIGVVCHELCHVFGADDYYDTDYNTGGDFVGTGSWDLMANGSHNDNGDTPAHINMFQKILYGWVDPIELDTDAITIEGMPNSAENPVAYIIKPYTNREQYILENRQRVGFDSKVPGMGLLIYHIHNGSASGIINNTTHPQRAYVVSASSTVAIPTLLPASYGKINSAGATFGNSTRTEFSTTSTPAMFRWAGTSGTTDGVLDKPLTDIINKNGLVSFKFKGGANSIANPTGESNVKLYPTVVTSSITIETQESAIITLRDASGRILSKITSQGETSTMNLDAYSSGMYLITIECADTVTTHKVMKK